MLPCLTGKVLNVIAESNGIVKAAKEWNIKKDICLLNFIFLKQFNQNSQTDFFKPN